MLVDNYKEALLDAIIGLLWRQWSRLGVMGYEQPGSDSTFLDPEALLIISARFARYDPRLYDLTAGWLLRFCRLLNPNRMKSLLGKTSDADVASLSYLASLCSQSGDKRWLPLAEKRKGGTLPEATPLFFQKDGTPLTYCPRPDELAMKCGFIRNEFIAANKQHRNLPETNATLLLRSRALLGVSSRADVALTLSLSSCNIQQLVDFCSFARSSVKEVLDDLETACVVSTIGSHARNVVYVLNHAEEFKQLLHITAPCYAVHWFKIYSVLMRLWNFVNNPLLSRVSDETVRGELDILFRTEIQPHLIHCGIPAMQQLTATLLQNLPTLLSEKYFEPA